MQSIIVLSKNREKIKKEVEKIALENKISKFDVSLETSDKQIGIEQIRNIKNKIFLRPIKGDKKLVILESYLGITQEAQNAFLKILEEPPISTIILITASALDFFLPTVLSRCNILNLDKNTPFEKIENKDFEQMLLKLRQNNIGYSFKLAQDYGKSREEALIFLENLALAAHDDLEKADVKTLLKNLQKTYTIIKDTNVSPRFALENLFLNLF